MKLTLTDAFEAAQLLALERLTRIATTSPSDHEARLACEAILKLADRQPKQARTSKHSPASPPPLSSSPSTPPDDLPLTPDELTRLRTLLPHVRPERFQKKHRPAHWRSVLAQLTQARPSRQAG